MADPFNLTTQYERQLAGVGDALRTLPGAIESGFTMGIQRRNQRLNERLLNEQIRGLETQNSINEQIVQNPAVLVDAFGDLKTTEERLQFLAKNAGIAAVPAGAKLMTTLEGITELMATKELNSLGNQTNLATIKAKAARAAKYGVDPANPEAMEWAMKSEQLESLFKDALDAGREIDASQITDDAWLAGGMLDPVKRIALINNAPLKSKAMDVSGFGQLLVERNQALLSGKMDAVAQYDAKINSEVQKSGFQLRTNPDGTFQLTQGSAGGAKNETEAVANARIYATRMENSERVFSELIADGFDPTAFFSGAGTLLPNVAQTEQVQRWQNAADNLISAILRKESGAAISDPERVSAYSEYIPRFGDQKGTVKDKAILRRKYLEQMEKSGGIAPPPGASSAGAPNAPASGNPPGTIADGSAAHPFTTEEEARKAPVGAYYINPADGKRYRKK